MKKILTLMVVAFGFTALAACQQQPCYVPYDDDRYEYDD